MKLMLLSILLFFQCNCIAFGDTDSSVNGIWIITNKSEKVGEIHINSGEYNVLFESEKEIEPEYFSKNRKGIIKFEPKQIELRDEVVLGILFFDKNKISYEIRKDINSKNVYFHSRISQLSRWNITKMK